jgi:hypothetical protein
LTLEPTNHEYRRISAAAVSKKNNATATATVTVTVTATATVAMTGGCEKRKGACCDLVLVFGALRVELTLQRHAHGWT